MPNVFAKELQNLGGHMDIEEIARKIESAGGRLYLVGGALRDAALDRQIEDKDYCVVGITSEKFINLFPEAKVIGKAFQVFQIEKNEFALARIEKKVGVGHKEFDIIANQDVTIEEDLERRDITINSIAKDVLTKEIVDPFNGMEDLVNGIIRATSSKFKEDPLRVYRVARFAATLGFKVEPRTIKFMKELREELYTLSKERVFIEFKKALEADKPSIFFNTLKDANVLDIHFKEIYDLIGSIQPAKYHPEGDSYNHTMLALDNSARLTKDVKIRFSTLVHDLGKGLTPKEMYPHHYGHDRRGVEPLKELCKRIGVPTEWKQCGIIAIEEHMKGGIFFKMSPSKQVNFIEKVYSSRLKLEGMQIVVYSDRARSYEQEIIDEQYNFVDLGNMLINEIDGKFIKEKYDIEEGEQFGKKLHEERVNWMKKQREIEENL